MATTFSVREIPFSARGSWLDVSPVVGLHRTEPHLHLVSHTTGMHPVLRLLPARDATVTAAPHVLTIADADGTIEVAFAAIDAVRMRGRGLALRLEDAVSALTPFTGSYLFRHPVDGAAVLTSYETGRRYRITTLAGSVEVVGAGLLGTGERAVVAGADGGAWELAVEELASETASPRSTETFDEIVARVEREFEEYRTSVAPWSTGDDASALAAYVLWSATVAPSGFLRREAVLMSKHWMDKVWSWDHCFNALALAPSDPEAAIDQFLTPFDHQAPSGALPDSITQSEVLYNFVKPPIHGWAWQELRARMPHPPSRDQLAEVYERLSSWTRYWLDHRRAPGHALPFYEHGNDSGWDNSTVFDADRVVESPDLAAFLVLQLDALAALGGELGDEHDWATRSDEVRAALLDELWMGDGFVARSVADGAVASRSSLLTALPILAAGRIPDEAADALATTIGRHLTEWGPATELVDSPHYAADGYWRGPIWAPSTFIVERGLRRAGRSELADTVSARFRALCERSGFAENFDALTGAGLRDRAYTWTASVYLVLAGEAAGR